MVDSPDLTWELRLLCVAVGVGVANADFLGRGPRLLAALFFPTWTLSLFLSASPSESSENESAEFPDITEREDNCELNKYLNSLHNLPQCDSSQAQSHVYQTEWIDENAAG